MKKVLIILSIIVGSLLTTSCVVSQPPHASVNIGIQPAWGPSGYNYVDYYYFPDLNVYYHVNNHQFVYYDRGGFWLESNYLPYAYRNYNLYTMYKVVINHQPYPWRYNRRHYHDYGHYRGVRNQLVIRDCHEPAYRRSHANNYQWYNRDQSQYKRRKANYATAAVSRESITSARNGYNQRSSAGSQTRSDAVNQRDSNRRTRESVNSSRSNVRSNDKTNRESSGSTRTNVRSNDRKTRESTTTTTRSNVNKRNQDTPRTRSSSVSSRSNGRESDRSTSGRTRTSSSRTKSSSSSDTKTKEVSSRRSR